MADYQEYRRRILHRRWRRVFIIVALLALLALLSAIGILWKVLVPMVSSPVLGFAAGFLVMGVLFFTISMMAGISRSLGLRHAAPMQNRVEPPSRA